jgi:ATP-dependent Lon protease
LLEELDPEQNKDFRDHYLDLPFDLSKVMFITTANTLDTIPAPLRDRMEILQLPGYTELEKVQIATKYLVSKQLKSHGLSESEITIDESALLAIIRDYTREAGVRNLEREVASVCRKVATQIAEGTAQTVSVDAGKVRDLLGKARYFAEVAERIDRPGVATGLVWTPVGGDIVFVEASLMPGKKTMRLTGHLGDTMRESAETALSLVRSKARAFGVDPLFFEKNDIHVHVPAGAVPKDGPSAGVTMVTALVSLLTSRPVRSDVAMTGEITLRGRVLPIGGLKEKVLGAHRAGIRTIILPKRNEYDLDELPPELISEMKFTTVETVEEVLAAALSDEVAATEGSDLTVLPEGVMAARSAG